MTTALTDYGLLLTSQYRSKPNFSTLVRVLTTGLSGTTAALRDLADLFDVDTAEGDQLDIIGEWVGASRVVAVPLAIYFSLDTSGLGFDEGSWRGRTDAPSGTRYLDDVTYRRLIKTVIKANYWDGSLRQYQEILQTAFVSNTIYAVDNFNMTLTIHVTGPHLSEIMSALLQSGRLSQIRQAGVSIASYVLPP